jgi:CHAD domain-containing protein
MAWTRGSHEYRFRRDESVAEGARRIAIAEGEEALERLRAIRSHEADEAEAIHGARKDLKRLRTLLRLLRPGLPRALYAHASGRFRDAGRALSASRDAEVKLRTLDALAAGRDDLAAGALEAWRKILARDREAASSPAAEAAVAEAADLIGAGLAEIEAWEEREDGWALLDAGVLRAYQRGREAMAAAQREGGEERLHEWRKRAKDLWYALRLLGEAWPPVLDPAAEEAHALSDLLGDHHDLAVLRADLRQRRLGEEETRALEAAIDRRQARLAAAALELGRRLYAEPPKAFRRRLRAYWRAWRR